ncbi:MAG: alpha/beta hydrolase [Christensenella sp.]|nr:alpha/beta hydrolase [Christensenella sp.]
MKTEKYKIGGIPAILWGGDSDRVYVYVHGKNSYKEYAEEFAEIADARGIQTLSFDLPEHGERKKQDDCCSMANAMADLSAVADEAFANWKNVSLFACSVGAHYSLHAYADRRFDHCLFQSPIVDMPYLVKQMFAWFDVTEERLRTEKTVSTPIDTIRWEDYSYLRAHPVHCWESPTSVLYGAKDVLQTPGIMRGFAERFCCNLTVSENSGHTFMEGEEPQAARKWYLKNIGKAPRTK